MEHPNYTSIDQYYYTSIWNLKFPFPLFHCVIINLLSQTQRGKNLSFIFNKLGSQRQHVLHINYRGLQRRLITNIILIITQVCQSISPPLLRSVQEQWLILVLAIGKEQHGDRF